MATFTENAERLQEDLAAELTEAALRTVAYHGVYSTSVDHELDLWQALGDVVRQRRRRSAEGLVAELVEAAYQVALAHGFHDAFVDVEMDLWETLCFAVRGSRPAARLFQFHRAGRGAGDCGCPALAVGIA